VGNMQKLSLLVGAALLLGCQAGYKGISFYTDTSVQIIDFSMVMSVPPLPPQKKGTLFIWPGLEPLNGVNYNPVNLGVLQPVLTYGPTCAPNQPPSIQRNPYQSWFISGMYVNTGGHVPGLTDCNGGPVMLVSPGDWLTIDMRLNGTNWIQNITSANTKQSVSFTINLLNQWQNWAILMFENYGNFTPSVAWTINNIHIETSKHDPYLCQGDYIQFEADGRTSCSGLKLSGNSCNIQQCKFKAGYPLSDVAHHDTLVRAGVVQRE